HLYTLWNGGSLETAVASGKAWVAGLADIIPYASGTPLARKADRARHNGRHNTAFCDGHVEYIKLEALYGRSNESRLRWNNDHEPHRESWIGADERAPGSY